LSPIPDTRYPIPDTRYPIPDTKGYLCPQMLFGIGAFPQLADFSIIGSIMSYPNEKNKPLLTFLTLLTIFSFVLY